MSVYFPPTQSTKMLAAVSNEIKTEPAKAPTGRIGKEPTILLISAIKASEVEPR